MGHTFEICLALGVVIPLLSFTVLVFFGTSSPLGKPRAAWVATAAIAASACLAWFVLISWMGLSDAERDTLTANAFRYNWGQFGDIDIMVGVKLDSLTIMMFAMVTFIATFIHIFSIGYMSGHSDEVAGESKYHRFFAYLGLFCFSMLGLVISSSLLFLFIFWELVGLCSYLLIGFYFSEKYASNASMKAFITNRVGDFGFIIGLALVVLYTKTFDLDEAAAKFAQHFATGEGIFAASINLFGWQVSGMALATLMGIGLFCGAMGKSAQFPLHVWLPDAMAGPTPVSALIHAATMVAAGVYLVARVFRLLTPDAQMFIAIIGCITLTMTALIAIVQTDIKKILAYSTLSQLGYMVFGMGVGAWTAALFHLITHAFFKAMLFLGSGQVIEGCHHEKNIMKMGGLRKKMPFTCWTFFIGVLAIAGFGIPGAHLGLGGYFSKDEILAVAYERAYNMDGAHAGDHSSDHGDGHGGDDHGDSHADDHGDGRANASVEIQHKQLASGDVRFVSAGGVFDVLSAAASTTIAAGDAHGGHEPHGTPDKLAIAQTLPHLPKWMFWLPIAIAYITPFYMMRCWWLTFMGKPRDQHVHDHAHEVKLMYVPLVVLAVGTFVSSYFIFRPLIAHAGAEAADAAAVVAFDGEAHSYAEIPGQSMLTLTHGDGWANPHYALIFIVGFSWLIGMGIAVLLYRNGPGFAGRMLEKSKLLRATHYALSERLFIDAFYDRVFVGGTVLFGKFWAFIDNVVVDGIVNVTGYATKGIGVFTGKQLDMAVDQRGFGLVDALADGIAKLIFDAGNEIRRPQNGRVRNYLLWTAGTAALVLICVIYREPIGNGLTYVGRAVWTSVKGIVAFAG